MNVGDIVTVVGSESIPKYFMGWHGKITGFIFDKAIVQLIPRNGRSGSLSHTALLSDLKLVDKKEGMMLIGVEGDAARQHP